MLGRERNEKLNATPLAMQSFGYLKAANLSPFLV